MILLGGDLFHLNKPSRRTLFVTMELLRRYCFGDRPCALEFLSEPRVNFPTNRFGNVNFEDANLKVGLPCFSIHGNHDDPAGDGNYCSLDLLSVAGLVNYFGKAHEVDDITVSPLLIRKGTAFEMSYLFLTCCCQIGRTRLAIYGLGSIRDERLHRTFRANKVRFARPSGPEMDEFFNVFLIHQNRFFCFCFHLS